MDDSSGRYTTGFFYGNNYFTGSLSLCTSIHRNDFYEDTIRKLIFLFTILLQNVACLFVNGLPFLDSVPKTIISLVGPEKCFFPVQNELHILKTKCY